MLPICLICSDLKDFIVLYCLESIAYVSMVTDISHWSWIQTSECSGFWQWLGDIRLV